MLLPNRLLLTFVGGVGEGVIFRKYIRDRGSILIDNFRRPFFLRDRNRSSPCHALKSVGKVVVQPDVLADSQGSPLGIRRLIFLWLDTIEFYKLP